MPEKKYSASSEAKTSQRRLEQISSEYDLVINRLPVAFAIYKAVYTTDTTTPVDYEIIRINKKYTELTGFTTETVENKSLKEVFPESDPVWEDYFEEAINTKESRQFDHYSARYNKWFDVTASSPEGDLLIVTFADISKRKKMEIELNKSKVMLNEMSRMAKVGGWEYNVDTGRVIMTDTLVEITSGERLQRFTNLQRYMAFFSQESRTRLETAYQKVIDEFIPFSIETKLFTSSGEEKWARIYGEPVVKDGVCSMIKGFLQDITQIKEVELKLIGSQQELEEKNQEYLAINEKYQVQNEELILSHSKIQQLNINLIEEKEKAERNEVLYFTIFNTIKEGIFIYRSKDKLEYINPAGCRMHGMTKEELLSKQPKDFIHPQTYSVFLEFIAAVDNDQEYYGEASGVTGKNEKFDVLVYGCPIYIGEEKLYYSAIVDITRQRQYEAEIEQKNNFIQRILDLNPNQIYIYDLENFQTYYFNKAASDFLGISIKEMRQMKETALTELLHPDDLQKVYIHLQKFSKAKDNDVFQIEYRMRDKGGNFRWFFSKDSVFERNTDGNVKYIIATATDVSDLKLIEQQLEDQNKEILAQNEEYQALNEELEESHSKLIKVNEELDSFVYRVSHDLRAPIASSLGLANLSLRESSLDYIKKYSQLQIESLQRLDNFIKDILDYSRNARISVKREPIDLVKLINEIGRSLLDYEFRRKRVEFVLDGPKKLSLYSDELRVKIILNNLLSNAFKYYDDFKEESFVKLTLSEINDVVVISIKDNGLGIGEEHVAKIYDMFYRATEKRTGSGLGLYIVKDCLNKIAGSIEMSTTEGMGTEFIVNLPQLKL